MTPTDKKHLEASQQLLALLGGAVAKKRAGEVKQAFEAPEAYVKRYAKALSVRGISEPVPLLGWVAVIDALQKARACVGIDWKTAPTDVARAVGKLGGAKQPKWLADRELAERSTEEALELAGAELRAAGKLLVSLESGGDEFNLVVVPKAKLTKVKQLAKATKQVIEVFDGSRLAQAESRRKTVRPSAPVPPGSSS